MRPRRDAAAGPTARPPATHATAARPTAGTLRVVDERPDRAGWERTVGLFAGAVGRGRIDKVVLARRVVFRGGRPTSTSQSALRHLAPDRAGEHDVRLRPRRDDVPRSDAGTARAHGSGARSRRSRSPVPPRAARDPAEDARLAAGSAREREGPRGARGRRRHAPGRASRRSSRRCTSPRRPAILPLRHLQHLVTPITGTTRDEAGLLALAGRLHPTPAVGGAPRDVALALIDEHEAFDRGWYAGPIGWLGADGDGELMVALRCGLVARPRGDAVRRLRDRGRLGSGPGVGGVAAQAADDDRRRSAGSPRSRRADDRTSLGRCAAMSRSSSRRASPTSSSAPGRARRRSPSPPARIPGLSRPRPARRAVGRVLRARPGPGVAPAGRPRRHLGDGGREPAAGRRRGVARAGPARRADRRPAARAARPRRAADDRPGPASSAATSAGSPSCRCSTARRRRGGTSGRSSAERWRRRAGGPAGPVHLNIGFREPLVPSAALGPLGIRARRPAADPTVRSPTRGRTRRAGRVGRWPGSPAAWPSVERGLIVAGPQDDPACPAAARAPRGRDRLPDRRRPAVGRSLRTARPVARRSAHADHLVRPGPWRDAHLPELVIRFGATPTSKPLLTLLDEASPTQIVVDGDRGWSDPAHHPDDVRPRRRDRHGAARWPTTLERPRVERPAATDGPWATRLVRRRPGRRRGARRLAGGRGGARRAVRGPAVRRPRRRRCPTGRSCGPATACRSATSTTGSRAASGRSGRCRTAARTGSTASSRPRSGRRRPAVGPVVLVVGDVSFLHDLNALVAARLHGLSATIVLIDNDGGGIFSFLPAGRRPTRPRSACPSTTRSCSGRPTASTSGRS